MSDSTTFDARSTLLEDPLTDRFGASYVRFFLDGRDILDVVVRFGNRGTLATIDLDLNRSDLLEDRLGRTGDVSIRSRTKWFKHERSNVFASLIVFTSSRCQRRPEISTTWLDEDDEGEKSVDSTYRTLSTSPPSPSPQTLPQRIVPLEFLLTLDRSEQPLFVLDDLSINDDLDQEV